MLIGIHGKARSGKDTVAQMLRPYGFRRTAFADPLKVAAATLFGWDLDRVLNDESFKEHVDKYWERKVRYMLQVLGTEAMRGAFGDDFWVKRWLLTYKTLMSNSHVVVTDVRFENEATAIRKQGGLVVHLLRHEAGLEGAEGAHASEQGITFQLGDFRLVNDGSLSVLESRVHTMMDFLLAPADGVQ